MNSLNPTAMPPIQSKGTEAVTEELALVQAANSSHTMHQLLAATASACPGADQPPRG